MARYIRNSYGNRPAHAGDMAEFLGLGRKGKIPAGGMDQREIQGIAVWVEARLPGDRFRLRVMCECPECGKVMPVGRLAQHSKVHE